MAREWEQTQNGVGFRKVRGASTSGSHFGKWQKKLCCSPCPSASRVPQTQTSPKTPCGARCEGTDWAHHLLSGVPSLSPQLQKALPGHGQPCVPIAVNGRGLRSCVTPSLGGSSANSQEPSQPKPTESPAAQHPNFILCFGEAAQHPEHPPTPRRCPHRRHLTEHHGRRAVGRGSFWSGGGWKEDVEEPELGRGLQEQRQRQQRNAGAAAPHGRARPGSSGRLQAKQPFIIFTQVQPRGTRAAGEGRAARGWP